MIECVLDIDFPHRTSTSTSNARIQGKPNQRAIIDSIHRSRGVRCSAQPATNPTSQGERYLFSKPNVFETDLHETDVRERLPELSAFFKESATRLAAAFTARLKESEGGGGGGGGVAEVDDTSGRAGDEQKVLKTKVGVDDDEQGRDDVRRSLALKLHALREGDDARTVKLQHNRGGGGCFPLHYDNPGPPSNRALTCILYLNPDWSMGDGGELQLVPFMRRPVRVAPRHDRLAVFLSDRVLHRVLPANKERFCLTVWLDGEGVNAPEDIGLRLPPTAMRDIPGTAEALAATPAQRLLSRAVYPDEYEVSLMECMAGAEGCSQMLESHRTHLKAVSGNAPLKALIDALRRLKEQTVDKEDELAL